MALLIFSVTKYLYLLHRLDRQEQETIGIFDENSIVLTPKTSAPDIDGWDSLAHIDLVVAIEAAFGIRFTSAELETMNQVGDIVTLIQKKQKL